MPQVVDGASDFFYELFGPQAGQHARTAVGMAELPHGIPVEINGEFEVNLQTSTRERLLCLPCRGQAVAIPWSRCNRSVFLTRLSLKSPSQGGGIRTNCAAIATGGGCFGC
jgi:hypothetical protein